MCVYIRFVIRCDLHNSEIKISNKQDPKQNAPARRLEDKLFSRS